ncbi:MAG: TetR/AcrR family transcriptional regulator [Cellvibrionaceae bacterium]
MVLLQDPQETDSGQPLTRRERRKLEVQNKICKAAVDLFETIGVEATTVEEICEQADVARKTFYNYYPSKLELVRALCDAQLFSRTEALLRSVLDQNLPASKTLKSYLKQLQEDLSTYGKIDRILIREAMLDASADSRATQHLAQLMGLFIELVERGQKLGDVKNDFTPDFYAQIILSTINGMMTAWMSHESFPIEERLSSLSDYLAGSVCC